MANLILRKKLVHFFNILDNNKNGSLNIDDFTQIGKNVCLNLSIKTSDNRYKQLISQSEELYRVFVKDLGKSVGDEISISDWLTYFENEVYSSRNLEMIKRLIQVTVKYVFELYDQNEDGQLNIEEYVDMFTIYGIDQRFSPKSFMKLDRNNDEVISKPELVNAVKEYFISTDPAARGNWIFGNWEDAA